MRAVVQRVSQASVAVDGRVLGSIDNGLCVLLAVAPDDTAATVLWMADRLLGLRIFADHAGKTNLSITDIGGAVLLISQFTLYADVRSGRRPSFTGSAPAAFAEPLWNSLGETLALRVPVACGRFGAHMQVSLVNDGPVTLIVDSP